MKSSIDSPCWYLDTSVAVRLVLGQNRAAHDWYGERSLAGDVFVSATLLVLELTRVLRREKLDPAMATDFTDEFALLGVDNALLVEAASIRPHVRSLDAIHLAAASRIGSAEVTIVTHDANMGALARRIGFTTHDPIS